MIDNNERPRVVRYITEIEFQERTTSELALDIEPINRKEIINSAKGHLALIELYRIDEFYEVQKSLKKWFELDFEVDHSKALLNNDKGEHHADNLQLLLKYHNGKKSKSNWVRFTFDEQKNYILKVLDAHKIVSSQDKLDVKINDIILESLLDRLKKIY